MRRPVSRGSSTHSGGFRSGTGGWKTSTKSSDTNNYGTSSLRSTIFSPGYRHSPLTAALVITSVTTPLEYDNRQYYWSEPYARERMSAHSYPTICEYQIGPDDGELQKVTFSNGTAAGFLYFGCSEDTETCCGVYCCHDLGKYFIMILGYMGVFALLALCMRQTGKDHDEAWKKYQEEKRAKQAAAARSPEDIPMVVVPPTAEESSSTPNPEL